MGLVQETQRVQELLGEYPDQCCAQPPELILLDQLVQIDTQQFKHQTEMLPVDERVLQTE